MLHPYLNPGHTVTLTCKKILLLFEQAICFMMEDAETPTCCNAV
jgi:hypothetical protein